MKHSGKLFHWTIIMVMKTNVNYSVKHLSSGGKRHTKVKCMPVLPVSLQHCNRLVYNLCFEIITALTLKANQINQGRVGTRPSQVLTPRPVEPRFTNSLFFKVTKSLSLDVPDKKLKENGCR